MEWGLFIFDYTLLIALNWFLKKNVILSFLFGSIDCFFLFAFRVFEIESFNGFGRYVIRIFISLLFSSISGYLLLKQLIDFNYIVARIGAGTMLLPLFNYFFDFIILRKIKAKNYIINGNVNGLKPILEELVQKSNGVYKFIMDTSFSKIKGGELNCKTDKVLVIDSLLPQPVRDNLGENIQVEYLYNVVEKVLKRIPIEVIDRFKEYYEDVFSKVKEPPLKRLLDVIFSVIGLVVFSPLLLVVSILILIEDGRPVFFKQLRIGKDGKPFMMYKFRTMKNETLSGPKFVDEEVDRLLWIGKLIRPFRLDECAQFLNILKGDMSIVGPRPEQVNFSRQFEQKIPYYSYRYKLKPGLTGWAQIMYKYASSLEETVTKLSYDLYYIKNRTIFMDLKIILQTIEVVLWRRGAK